MKATDLAALILNEGVEGDLNFVWEALREKIRLQQQQRNAIAAVSFSPGDRVVLRNIRPRHYEGQRGKIVRRVKTRLVVMLDGHTLPVTVPAGVVEREEG